MFVVIKHQPNDRWSKISLEHMQESWFSSLYFIAWLYDEGNISVVDGIELGDCIGKVHSWKQFQEYKQRYIGDSKVANYELANDEPKKDAINPAHYKSLLEIKSSDGTVTDVIQWLEHLQYKPFWRNNMRAFVHAVRDLCADKYLSRMGMKDDETQEMEKALWYFKFATAVMKNNYQPVRVDDIERILNPRDDSHFLAMNDLGEVLAESPGKPIWFKTREEAMAGGSNVIAAFEVLGY